MVVVRRGTLCLANRGPYNNMSSNNKQKKSKKNSQISVVIQNPPKPKKEKKNKQQGQLQLALSKADLNYRLQEQISRLSLRDIRLPKKWEYLGALVNPAAFPGARLPDVYNRVPTLTYQSKLVFNVKGISGTTAGGDAGRFSYVFQPILSTQATFSATTNVFQVSIQDGAKDAATWKNFYEATAATNYMAYAQDPNLSVMFNSAHSGLAARWRPVSMSVLASYTGNLINGGGNIAAALLPGNMWPSGHANTTAPPAFLSNWENLAKYPEAYDGPIYRGSYSYWLPDDEEDLFFSTGVSGDPENPNTHSFPSIAVAGQFTGTATDTVNSLRIECFINYEYTMTSRTVAGQKGSFDESERTLAMVRLRDQPTSMENDTHIDWIKVILGGAAGFFVGGPVGAAFGAAAGAGISGFGSLLKPH